MSEGREDVDVNVVSPSLPSYPASCPTVNTSNAESKFCFLATQPDFSELASSGNTFKENAAAALSKNQGKTQNPTDQNSVNESNVVKTAESDAHIPNVDPNQCFVVTELNQLSEKLIQLPNMGNKQTNLKTAHEEDDIPDEGKTKCCQVPKKKLKEKNKRVSRGSRSDDLAFESDEVYPFERRSGIEQELNEPVELEPFEIVETDDIRFVPGAGTSDVIKSVSEPKFTTIPEEVLLEENEEQGADSGGDVTAFKPVYINKGNKIMESGTSTAHSTFEFKQTTKTKSSKNESLSANDHLYENIKDSNRGHIAKPSTSAEGVIPTSSSNSSSNDSSKNVSRKNSKEAIQKPLRKSKKGKQPTEVEGSSKIRSEEMSDQTKIEEKQNKQRSKKSDQPAIRDSEIDRNIDSVLMLTQTMFSKQKKPDAEIVMPPEQSSGAEESLEANAEGKYENVNVCIKFEPTGGISIAHKETKQMNDAKNKRKNSKDKTTVTTPEPTNIDPADAPIGKYENFGLVAKFEPTGITVGHKDSSKTPAKCVKVTEKKTNASKQVTKSAKESDKKKKRKASDDKEFVQISRSNSTTESLPQGILHISDSGTLIIKGDKKECEHGCPENIGAEPLETPAQGRLHISDSGTLIIQSLPKPPIHAPSSEPGENHYYENDIIDKEMTDIKVPYETDNFKPETEKSTYLSAIEEKKELAKQIENAQTKDENVPPPSPLAMDILQEEEEEEVEDDDQVFEDEEEKRKSIEMFEFTENVCKRLSQLLEVTPNDNDQEDYLFESGTFEGAENIYETINDRKKWKNYDNLKGPPVIPGSQNYDNLSGSFSNQDSLEPHSSSIHPSESSGTLKRASGDSEQYNEKKKSSLSSEEDDLPEYFNPRDGQCSETCPKTNANTVAPPSEESFRNDKSAHRREKSPTYERIGTAERAVSKQLTLPLRTIDHGHVEDPQPINNNVEDLRDRTPTAETITNLSPLTELATAQENIPVQFEATSGRRSVTCTESDLDISEHRDDLSTDSMLADDEEEETMEILFTKTYTEPVEGAEVFLSCTVVNSAYKDEHKKSETWLSDEALEYLEANASDVMSTAFLKAKREMKDIQVCLQSLRKQMEHFHSDHDDISLPEIPVESLSPDYFGLPRKAITD